MRFLQLIFFASRLFFAQLPLVFFLITAKLASKKSLLLFIGLLALVSVGSWIQWPSVQIEESTFEIQTTTNTTIDGRIVQEDIENDTVIISLTKSEIEESLQKHQTLLDKNPGHAQLQHNIEALSSALNRLQ